MTTKHSYHFCVWSYEPAIQPRDVLPRNGVDHIQDENKVEILVGVLHTDMWGRMYTRGSIVSVVLFWCSDKLQF
jgi:hypothetical protein